MIAGSSRSRAYGRRSWRNLAERTVRHHPWCVVCHSKRNLVADHVRPVEVGGALLDPTNVQVVCKPCNTSKGVRTMAEWQRTDGYARRAALRGRADDAPSGPLSTRRAMR